MYFPYLRGRQFELIAIRELIERNLISDKVIPVIEPVKVSATLLKTIEFAEKTHKTISIITNPKVGHFMKDLAEEKNKGLRNKYYELLSSACSTLYTRIVDGDEYESMKFLESYGSSFMTICMNKDMIQKYDEYFKNAGSLYNIIPDETGFRRKIRENRVMIDDKFIKLERNVDYEKHVDEPFSEDHLYFSDDGYVGFSDFSIVGDEYSETGFAPYAVAIHIVYFDENKALRIRHFVSDSNDDIKDIAGKFKEAMEKLIEWNKKQKMNTYGINQLENLYHMESYPGLGTVKKLSIMHHLELISSYLSGGMV